MLARIWGFGMWPSSCRRSSDHQSAPCCSHCSSVIATAARPRRFPCVGPGALLKFGNRLEVFHGPAVAGDPFRPGWPISGFRTGPARYGTRRAQRQRRRTAAILLPRLAEPIGPAISTAASEQALKFALDSPLEERRFELVWGFSCQVVVLVYCQFFVRSGKAVLRPVACGQVPGARGRGQGTETLAQLGGLPP